MHQRADNWPACARSISVRLLVITTLLSLGLTACGGGGGGGETSTPPPPTTPANPTTPAGPTPTATLVAPASGKSAWNTPSDLAVTLRDAQGAVIAGPLACSSPNTVALTVAPDCSSITGQRLGVQTITVSGGGVTGNVSVKVIPQAQPIGTNGAGSNAPYNLVVTQQGRVLGWGSPIYGTAGQGSAFPQSNNPVTLPLAVKNEAGTGELSNIVAVSSGVLSALALTEDGEVWSWGSASGGRGLGRPNTTMNADRLPGKVRNAANSGPLSGIVSVAVGDWNAIALADDGSVYAWGYLPGSEPQSARFPILVPDAGGAGVLSNAVAISAGGNWGAVLTQDGRVVTWGSNNFNSSSALGQGSTASIVVSPGFVIDDATRAPISDIVALSAGYRFGLALTSGGEVFAWGYNSSGQLGQNTSSSSATRGALKVKNTDNTTVLKDIAMVAAGGNHALAVDTAGRVFSWGLANDGQLGDGPNRPVVNESRLPRPVVSEVGILQLSNVAMVATGYNHSLALSKDGGLLIWGDGFEGNLGQGSTRPITGLGADSPTPIRVLNANGNGSLSLSPLAIWPNLLQRSR